MTIHERVPPERGKEKTTDNNPLIDYDKLVKDLPTQYRTPQDIEEVTQFVNDINPHFNKRDNNRLYATVKVRMNPSDPDSPLINVLQHVKAAYINFCPALIYHEGEKELYVRVPGLRHEVITRGHFYSTYKDSPEFIRMK